MNTPIEGRWLDPARDVPQMLELFTRVFQKPVDRESWSWKYLPPWTAQPLAWIAATGGRVIGHVGAVPLRGQFDGKDTLHFQLCDVMVDPDFRSARTLEEWKPVQLVEGIRSRFPDAVLYGFTSPRLSRWYSFLGMREGQRLIEPVYEWVLKPAAPSTHQEGIEIHEIDWNAPVIDEIWGRLKDQTPGALVRDRGYLAWRYQHHPSFRYRLFGVHRDGQITGWLVTGRMDSVGEPLESLRVHDWLVPLDARLAVLQQTMQTLNAGAIRLWMPEAGLPADVEKNHSGWVVIRLALSGQTSALSRSYYTFGEADQWWW